MYRSITSGNTGNVPVSSPAHWVYIGENACFYKSQTDDNDAYPIVSANWEKLGADPRHALLKDMHIDLVLYKLHARIKPRQIPDHRIALRDEAIAFLKDCADPRKNVTLDLPLVDHGEQRGVDMSFGGNTKQNHTY